jgi:Tfp pilus assembly protein PilO
MHPKIKNSIIIGIIFLIITSIGGYYTWSVQKKELTEKATRLNELNSTYSSPEIIQAKLAEVQARVAEVDSLLFTGKLLIPQNLSQSQFFDFVDAYSTDKTIATYTNTEFLGQEVENGFNYYRYKVYGIGNYNDVYRLTYAIENSKELKKIMSADLTATNIVSKQGGARYLVKFDLEVRVYFSSQDQFAAVNYEENDLIPKPLNDAYFPLVKTTIRPVKSDLPDVQDGSLISLVPQGAFIIDSEGNTRLMQKGEEVFLGYLTDIDYDNQTVTFVLNKGGMIEYQTMKLGENFKRKGSR